MRTLEGSRPQDEAALGGGDVFRIVLEKMKRSPILFISLFLIIVTSATLTLFPNGSESKIK